MSLNLLMLVCLVLIIIFSATPQDNSQSKLPPVPKLHIDQWKTDSGAKVWFSPMLSDTIEVQLWYLAGFGFDGQDKGKAQLLAQLLKYESRQRKLDMDISLDQDFLKLSLTLSKQPSTMNAQIKKAVELIYRPQLSSALLGQIRQSHSSASQALLMELYQEHPYAGPKQGHEQTLNQLTRKDLQGFQQSHLHPERLYIGLSGDMNTETARVISERLLPKAKYPAQPKQAFPSQDIMFASQNQLGAMIWPSLKSQSSKGGMDDTLELEAVDHYMLYQILTQVHAHPVRFAPGLANSTVLIEQQEVLKQTMNEDLDSALIATAKRSLLKNWLQQLQTPQGLSKHLVQLNAYGYGVMEMENRRNALMEWDQDRWFKLNEQFLSPLINSHPSTDVRRLTAQGER